jgi:phage host-nuclease inhibitor protein Gam
MWKDLFDLVRQALRLAEDTQQVRAELKELQREVRDLTHRAEREALEIRHEMALQMQALRAQVERQNDEIRHLREDLQQSHEREAVARRMLLTEVENQILKANRQLPPASGEKNKDEP